MSGTRRSQARVHEGFRTVAVVLAGATVLAGLFFAIFAIGADRWSPPAIAPQTVVARVHEEPVLWAEVAERLQAGDVMGRPQPTNLAMWRTAVQITVDSIVGDVLTRHLMEGEGVSVSDEAIDAEVATIRESYGGEDGLGRAMADMRVSMAQLRETQRRGLYQQAMIARFVPATDAAIDAYLASPGVIDVSRAEAAGLVRRDAASNVIDGIMSQLRADSGVWVVDVTSLR